MVGFCVCFTVRIGDSNPAATHAPKEVAANCIPPDLTGWKICALTLADYFCRISITRAACLCLVPAGQRTCSAHTQQAATRVLANTGISSGSLKNTEYERQGSFPSEELVDSQDGTEQNGQQWTKTQEAEDQSEDDQADKEEYRFSPSVNDQCLNIGRKGDSHPRNVAALRRAGTSVHFHREI
ncbi:hypothetical protein SDJN02_14241, partial [Cucurbita argyrosperma subsp. argyrosperma]